MSLSIKERNDSSEMIVSKVVFAENSGKTCDGKKTNTGEEYFEKIYRLDNDVSIRHARLPDAYRVSKYSINLDRLSSTGESFGYSTLIGLNGQPLDDYHREIIVNMVFTRKFCHDSINRGLNLFG